MTIAASEEDLTASEYPPRRQKGYLSRRLRRMVPHSDLKMALRSVRVLVPSRMLRETDLPFVESLICRAGRRFTMKLRRLSDWSTFDGAVRLTTAALEVTMMSTN